MTNTEREKSINQNWPVTDPYFRIDIKRMIITAFRMFKKLSRGMQDKKRPKLKF